MKLTKIVATIGPASDSEEMIRELINLGVNVFRFNFKHSDVTWHQERVERVKNVAAQMQQTVGVLLDLQGPEIRMRLSADGVDLVEGKRLELKPALEEGNLDVITVTQPEIIPHLQHGQKVVADDGYFQFLVEVEDNRCFLKSLSNGFLKNRKTLNLPGANIPISSLSESDMVGLEMAAQTHVDYIALSFVRDTTDIGILRAEMEKRNISSQLVTKIETQQAIDNIDSVISASDAVMVARGDLAVEISYEQVPYLQRLIISKCIQNNKPVITATQMLESMITSPFPTRAEASDVATATYEYSDAVMLSAESASGKYPKEAVTVMTNTTKYNEVQKLIDTRTIFEYDHNGQTQHLCDAAYDLYLTMTRHEENVSAFVVFTHTGNTARLISRFHPKVPIIAICPNDQVARSLTLNFGVLPIVYTDNQVPSTEIEYHQIRYGVEYLQNRQILNPGSKVIVVYGDFWMITGSSSTVKLVTV